MTKTFKIEAGVMELTFEAETAEAAVLAYVQETGYRDVEHAADALNQSVEEFLSDVTVTEV